MVLVEVVATFRVDDSDAGACQTVISRIAPEDDEKVTLVTLIVFTDKAEVRLTSLKELA